ncbi:MAG: DNA translocase FtsK 4TM domain-containing protein [Myxococcota bacterium]|jgi:S-DNA-T family DNA segregation ATPase FtsK/SpoIIIE|nr:DNA translocase FtsK 4TM domain-containing protein [Myxococcota bacterium]
MPRPTTSTSDSLPTTTSGDLSCEKPSRGAELLGLGLGLGAVLLLLSLVSYDGMGPDGAPLIGGNIIGVMGDWLAFSMLSLFGLSAYLLALSLFAAAASLLLPRFGKARLLGIISSFLLVVLSSIVLHTLLREHALHGGHLPGGLFGEVAGEILLSLLSVTGTLLVCLGGIVATLVVATDVSLSRTMELGFSHGRSLLRAGGRQVFRIVRAWREEYEIDETPKPRSTKAKEQRHERESPALADASFETALSSEPTLPKTMPGTSSEPKIVKKRLDTKAPRKKEERPDLAISTSPLPGQFQLPGLELLRLPPPPTGENEIDEKLLRAQADKLVSILADFNVFGEVKEIHPGPVVTMYEFQPRSGTKLSKIESLSSELAMALEVLRVRVVAPIPGKNAVGFELPNLSRETVYLRELLIDESFSKPSLKLPMALGKDIGGATKLVDLAKMPHLLIAGTTGSGKSVSLNAMLLSLLFRHTPDDLRLLLIDPKMVEMGVYEGIPHLLLPVVSDMSKACLALKWAVDEMERRYGLFAQLQMRNLEGYNAKVARLKEQHAARTPQEREAAAQRTSFAIQDEQVIVVADAADNPEPLEKLPLIVIVIDELADLMMVAAKDVEISIARLAQKARAAGIHLIVATQRPSVDVITGLIKANFPSRLSFRVSSNHDSRTILGCNGAENLLGMGDMLVLPPGTSDLLRVHGAYVADEEIHDITTFLKAQGAPRYDEEILRPRDDEGALEIDATEKDEVYDQAVAIVAESGFCSISMLQRRLRIGYNRAARIVEIMEKDGVVGPANHQNKREVLIAHH